MSKTKYQTGYRFPDRAGLNMALDAIMSCGHPHRFAVEKDNNAIWTSDFGWECVVAVVAEHWDRRNMAP